MIRGRTLPVVRPSPADDRTRTSSVQLWTVVSKPQPHNQKVVSSLQKGCRCR